MARFNHAKKPGAHINASTTDDWGQSPPEPAARHRLPCDHFILQWTFPHQFPLPDS